MLGLETGSGIVPVMKTVTGSCHCKAITYETELDLSHPAIECNCSHCQIKGLILQFVPRDILTITKGEDSLTEYTFNTGKIRHLFCPTCGVEPFAAGEMPDGSPVWGVNLRTLDGIDLGAITRTPYNGKDI